MISGKDVKKLPVSFGVASLFDFLHILHGGFDGLAVSIVRAGVGGMLGRLNDNVDVGS